MRILRVESRKYFQPRESAEKFCILAGRLPEQGSANHTLALVELASGAASDPHLHSQREESYFVLSGSGEATINDETVSISRGDLISTKPGERHQFKADLKGPLTYLVVTAPAWVPQDSQRDV